MIHSVIDHLFEVFLALLFSEKSLLVIFHDFLWPILKFHDFPGLENDNVQFHDFLGFPWPVRTLRTPIIKKTQILAQHRQTYLFFTILFERQFSLLSPSPYTALSRAGAVIRFLHFLRFPAIFVFRPFCTCTTIFRLGSFCCNIRFNPRRVYHSLFAVSTCDWRATGGCSDLGRFSGPGFCPLNRGGFVKQFFSQGIKAVFDANRRTGTINGRILYKWAKIMSDKVLQKLRNGSLSFTATWDLKGHSSEIEPTLRFFVRLCLLVVYLIET